MSPRSPGPLSYRPVVMGKDFPLSGRSARIVSKVLAALSSVGAALVGPRDGRGTVPTWPAVLGGGPPVPPTVTDPRELIREEPGDGVFDTGAPPSLQLAMVFEEAVSGRLMCMLGFTDRSAFAALAPREQERSLRAAIARQGWSEGLLPEVVRAVQYELHAFGSARSR